MKFASRAISRNSAWAGAGCVVLVSICFYFLAKPYDLADGFLVIEHSAIAMAAACFGLTVLYVIFQWLQEKPEGMERELGWSPLPRTQHFAHRLFRLSGIPALVSLVGVLCFASILVYIGTPYAAGIHETRWFFWGDSHDSPWGIRMLLVALNLPFSALIPATLGSVLNELLANRFIRIVLFLGALVAGYFAVRQAEFSMFRRCYSQTKGLDPLPFVIVIAVLAVFPFVACITRKKLGQLPMVIAVLAAALVFALAVTHRAGDLDPELAAARDWLGDWRFAIAYAVGHLSPEMNIKLTMESYPSMVLLDDHNAGNLIPRRVSMWVGTGIYPWAMVTLVLAGLGLGCSLVREDNRP